MSAGVGIQLHSKSGHEGRVECRVVLGAAVEVLPLLAGCWLKSLRTVHIPPFSAWNAQVHDLDPISVQAVPKCRRLLRQPIYRFDHNYTSLDLHKLRSDLIGIYCNVSPTGVPVTVG